MKNSFGKPKSCIWLVGDSPPVKWEKKLEYPFDPRHPTRHSIWTPVENYFQKSLYEKKGCRVETAKFYIINAVENYEQKPKNKAGWDDLNPRIKELHGEIQKAKPILILTFGSFSFELLRRVLGEDNHIRHTTYWGCERLGDEFTQRINEWKEDEPNLLPLLHATIARGKFLEAHKLYCGDPSNNSNYFESVGNRLADLFIDKFLERDIWAKQGD